MHRICSSVFLTGLVTFIAAQSHAAQQIPGVDIIVKKTPSGKAHVFAQPGIPQGTVDQLNDYYVPLATISTTRSNTRGGMNAFSPSSPPTDLGGGNWAVDSFFDITYRIDFEGGGGGGGGGGSGGSGGSGGITPFEGFGSAHVVGPGQTLADRDGDGDEDAEDALLSASEGPIHQFDVELDVMDLADPNTGWLIRESPTLQSTGQILRRDLPDGRFVVASFFDVFVELSLDGGQSWLPASSSVQFMTVPEPTTLLLAPSLASMALVRRGKRRTT